MRVKWTKENQRHMKWMLKDREMNHFRLKWFRLRKPGIKSSVNEYINACFEIGFNTLYGKIEHRDIKKRSFIQKLKYLLLKKKLQKEVDASIENFGIPEHECPFSDSMATYDDEFII